MNFILIFFISAIQFFSIFRCMEQSSINESKEWFHLKWIKNRPHFLELVLMNSDIKTNKIKYPVDNDCVNNLFFLDGYNNIEFTPYTEGLFPRRASLLLQIICLKKRSELFKYFFEKSSPKSYSCKLKEFQDGGVTSYAVSLYENGLELEEKVLFDEDNEENSFCIEPVRINLSPSFYRLLGKEKPFGDETIDEINRESAIHCVGTGHIYSLFSGGCFANGDLFETFHKQFYIEDKTYRKLHRYSMTAFPSYAKFSSSLCYKVFPEAVLNVMVNYKNDNNKLIPTDRNDLLSGNIIPFCPKSVFFINVPSDVLKKIFSDSGDGINNHPIVYLIKSFVFKSLQYFGLSAKKKEGCLFYDGLTSDIEVLLHQAESMSNAMATRYKFHHNRMVRNYQLLDTKDNMRGNLGRYYYNSFFGASSKNINPNLGPREFVYKIMANENFRPEISQEVVFDFLDMGRLDDVRQSEEINIFPDWHFLFKKYGYGLLNIFDPISFEDGDKLYFTGSGFSPDKNDAVSKKKVRECGYFEKIFGDVNNN
jgi:hypothetical protein